MFCESYREALSEAAAGGEALRRELQVHLAGCEACGSAFAAEQRLFASINSAMSAAVNVEPPASLLPGVRARVASVPERTLRRELFPAFALALALVWVFAVSVLYRSRAVPGPSRLQNITASVHPSAPAASQATSRSSLAAGPGALRPQVKKGRSIVRPAAVHSEPQVLASSEEQFGFQRYAARLSARAPQFSARATVIDNTPFKIRPLQIDEIDVGQLAIEPLESGQSN